MKTLLYPLIRPFVLFALYTAITLFPACNSSDDEGPCARLECLNGGEKITGVDRCECDCPPGYSGDNCQTKDATCPVNVECPIGKTPNPAKNCACE